LQLISFRKKKSNTTQVGFGNYLFYLDNKPVSSATETKSLAMTLQDLPSDIVRLLVLELAKENLLEGEELVKGPREELPVLKGRRLRLRETMRNK